MYHCEAFGCIKVQFFLCVIFLTLLKIHSHVMKNLLIQYKNISLPFVTKSFNATMIFMIVLHFKGKFVFVQYNLISHGTLI